MAATIDLFSFPPGFDIQSFAAKDTKICVVAVIGQTRFSPFASKASLLNPVLDRDVFQGLESVIGEKANKSELHCYYDDDTQMLYLHLLSHLDTPNLVRHCQDMASAHLPQDFYTYWQDSNYRHAKMLLFLFSLSHIILLVHPGSTFQVSNIKLFRNLDSVRLKLQAPLCELLRELPLSKEWAATGRLCSPRVLFVFQTPTFPPGSDDETVQISSSKSRTQKVSPLKRLQHNLEDQIYRILRKSRVITNISNNSLFAVPANQEFVYVHCRKNEATEPVTFFLNQIRNNSGLDSPRTRSYLMTRRANSSNSFSEGQRSPLMTTRQENSFKEFLWQHVEMAFRKGFDDNVGRNPVLARFELPSASLWYQVAMQVHHFLFDSTPEGRAQGALNTLRSLLDPDLRFSENRCSKIIPLAESAYQQDLPPFYVTAYHLSKLAQAKHVFTQIARGPAYEKYLAQLEESCTSFWHNGRQQCEAVSLSGNLCVNKLHRALSDIVTLATVDLPVMAHSSQLKTRAACNCGRQQADKDDPFDHRSANYDFYMTLEAGCCGTLRHIDMPTFKASTANATAAHSEQVHRVSSTSADGVVTTKADIVSGMSALSLALSLGQSGNSDLYPNGHSPVMVSPSSRHEHEQELSQSHSIAVDLVVESEAPQQDRSGEEKDSEMPATQDEREEEESDHSEIVVEKKETVLPLRQHSTTEYLPAMLHSNSPPGLLPKFPSWSLCCLDSPSAYNPLQGLDLPGFIPGSNFLLPWDIAVSCERERWPTIGETATSRRGRNIRRSQKESSENTLRVYIGLEYECPHGHRFFCSAPDKVIKVIGGTVKDTATRVLSTDMPLFTSCHCHNPKGFLAQLMRVYTAVPEGPLQILLQPLVRPAPLPCPTFHIGTDEPIALPSGGIWVLRLPHVYMGDSGPYSMPPDLLTLHACVIQKGLFSHREIASEG